MRNSYYMYIHNLSFLVDFLRNLSKKKKELEINQHVYNNFYIYSLSSIPPFSMRDREKEKEYKQSR